MTLVQELRAQLERVARDPKEMWCGDGLSDDAFLFSARFDHGDFGSCPQGDRVSILTAAIRAAVVTREAKP